MDPAASNKPTASPASGYQQAQFGPYRLESLIGQGAMGQVYRAVDTARDRVVAIKLLPAPLAANPEFRARFRTESALTARLREPHIVPIHDYGEIDGRLYIDMRLVEGTDLAHLLAQHGPLSPERAVNVVAQVASALDAAHAADLAHRDIKPSNILVANAGDGSAGEFVYVADFGLARLTTDSASSLTMTGATVGSLSYMAPERFTGGHGDHRVDIYALGCLLFETLTGHGPFAAEGMPAIIHAHLNHPPPRLSQDQSGLLAELDTVITRAMAKNPDDRYSSAGALAAAARAAVFPSAKSKSIVDEPFPNAVPFSRQETVIRAYHPAWTDPDDQPAQNPRLTSPTIAASPGARSPRSNQLFLVAALLFGIVIALIAIRPWDSSSNPPSTTAPTPSQFSDQISVPTQLPSTNPAIALRQQANADRPALTAISDGMWVPQVSSKRVGLIADGINYDNTAILANYQRWRTSFPAAKLLWSGDWGTFKSATDYWVTVVAAAFNTPDEANQWCDAQSLPSNDCFARRLTTSSDYSQNIKTR